MVEENDDGSINMIMDEIAKAAATNKAESSKPRGEELLQSAPGTFESLLRVERPILSNGSAPEPTKLRRNDSRQGAYAIAGIGASSGDDSERSRAERAPDHNEDDVGLAGTPNEEKLISAVLVDSGDKEDAPTVEATVMDMRKRNIRLVTGYVILTLIFVGVVVGVAISLKSTSSSSKEPAIISDPSPSAPPSMAPSVDYIRQINSYDYVTNFINTGIADLPKNCTTTAENYKYRISVACFDGDDDDFGMIYSFKASETYQCIRLEKHHMQCELTLTDTGPVILYGSIFACGTFSGNATLEVIAEPLYDVSECDHAGGMSSFIQAICETDETKSTPFCDMPADGNNLGAVDPFCSRADDQPGYFLSLTTSSNCSAPDLESSKAYILRDVFLPVR